MRFSKNPQTFRDQFFFVEGQTERGMGMMSLTVAFCNYKRDTDIQMAWEISVIHTTRITDIALLCVRSQQLYTPSIDWHKRFQFRKSGVHIWRWSRQWVIQNFIEELTGNISKYVTTTSFSHSNWLVTILNMSLPLPSHIQLTCNNSQYVTTTSFPHSNWLVTILNTSIPLPSHIPIDL